LPSNLLVPRWLLTRSFVSPIWRSILPCAIKSTYTLCFCSDLVLVCARKDVLASITCSFLEIFRWNLPVLYILSFFCKSCLFYISSFTNPSVANYMSIFYQKMRGIIIWHPYIYLYLASCCVALVCIAPNN
jgi:hypothetical protein